MTHQSVDEPVHRVDARPVTADAWKPFGWLPLADTDPADGDDTLHYEWGDAHLNTIEHTTDEIDAYVHELHIERNAYPSPLNYNGFPKSVCTSANEVICHGIPDSRVLQDGDILNIDVTAYVDGVHGDTNATFFVGDVDPASRQLVRVTEAAALAAARLVGRGDKEAAYGDVVSVMDDLAANGLTRIAIVSSGGRAPVDPASKR